MGIPAAPVVLVNRIRDILLDRWVVLLSILLLALTVALGLVLPQNQRAAEFGAFATALGLDHVFSGWWFRTVAGVAALQLCLVTWRLARRDWRRARRERGPGSREPFPVSDSTALAYSLKDAHYTRVRRSTTVARYVKDVWGYAGPALLHAGMLGVVLSVLANSLTISAGVLTCIEGATALAGTTLGDPQQGPLGAPVALAEGLRLDYLDITYWPDGEPRKIAGTYAILKPEGDETVAVVTNKPVVVDGLRIFQDPRVGYAYGVTLERDGIVMKKRLTLPLPASSDEPSYLDTELDNGDLLRAKVIHDPTVPGGAPVLTLRLMRGDDIVGEQSFDSTDTAMLGDTSVSVDVATRWSVVILERARGMGLLFASFFAILAGAMLIYGATPRELTLVKHDDGTVTAEWHAVRFARLYASEERLLREAASGAKEGGGD